MKKLISLIDRETKTFLLIGLVLTLSAYFITGCVSTGQPVITQGPNGTSVTNPGPATVDPRIAGLSNTIAGGLGLASAVPAAAPYANLGLVANALVFGALGGVSGWLAQRRNTTTANKLLSTVIQGVEDGTSSATITADSLKTAIQNRATAAGVQPILDTVVQKLT